MQSHNLLSSGSCGDCRCQQLKKCQEEIPGTVRLAIDGGWDGISSTVTSRWKRGWVESSNAVVVRLTRRNALLLQVASIEGRHRPVVFQSHGWPQCE